MSVLHDVARKGNVGPLPRCAERSVTRLIVSRDDQLVRSGASGVLLDARMVCTGSQYQLISVII